MQPPRTGQRPAPAGSGIFDAGARAEIRAKLFDLIKQRSFGRGRVVLASGKVSDFYFDMKPTMLSAAGAAWLAEMILGALEGLAIDYVGGPEMGAVPLVGAIGQLSYLKGRPINGFFVRKAVKEHGAKKTIEGLGPGETLRGKNVVIVEDVTTTGASALRAVDAVRAEGANVVMVLTIVDRSDGAQQIFGDAGLSFRWLFSAQEFLAA